ncbi:MAG: hypothetical protein RI897_2694 [Verrucomicrobiota bacterium]
MRVRERVWRMYCWRAVSLRRAAARTPKITQDTTSVITVGWDLEGLHDVGHGECGAGDFDAAAMGFAEAADAGLLFVLEVVDPVDDGDERIHLEFGEGVADGVADMLGVGGFALEDHAEAEDGGEAREVIAGEGGGDHGDFEGAGYADDLDGGDVGGFEFGAGVAEECVDVALVILGGDDGEVARVAGRGGLFGGFFEHG